MSVRARGARFGAAVVLLTSLLAWPVSTAAVGSVIYVDVNATGADNGSSWIDAYADLGDGLAAASAGDELWVADGTYYGGFSLVASVHVYGGFAGDELTLDERDPSAHQTILSGNDAERVVTAADNATLDGFIVTGGLVNDADPSTGGGGGIFATNVEGLVLNNLRVVDNTAAYGGGMVLRSSVVNITNSLFEDNVATNPDQDVYNEPDPDGGAIQGRSSNVTIEDSVFTHNSASAKGGGISLVGQLTVHRALFEANTAGYQEGVALDFRGSTLGGIGDGTVDMDQVVIRGHRGVINTALIGARGTINRLLFEDNQGSLLLAAADLANSVIKNNGVGLELHYSDLNIANTTITGNLWGMTFWGESHSSMVNSIVWGNVTNMDLSQVDDDLPDPPECDEEPCPTAPPYVEPDPSYFNIQNSIVEGGIPAKATDMGGNIYSDPQFVDPATYDPAHLGDLHLQKTSPAIGTGLNSAVVGDADYDGGPRITPNGGTVDIGAYEYLTARGLKQSAIAALEDMLPTGSGEDDALVHRFIDRIQMSLNPTRWDGEDALIPSRGRKVFVQERRTVARFLSSPLSSDPDARAAIDMLVAADRRLASLAIDASASPRAIASATRKLHIGDKYRDLGNLSKAIYWYWRAWTAVNGG